MSVSPLTKWRTMAYCVLWCLSILIGYTVLWTPTLPLLLIHRPIYIKITDVLCNIWETFNVSLISTLLGVRVRVSGDPVRSDETAIILCNHRTRLDWNFVWSGLFNAGWPNGGHSLKLVLKDNVKKIPGIGWIMQMLRCLYLKRDWKEDESRMARMIRHWSNSYSSASSVEDASDISKRSFQLLLFPEGTNLTETTMAKSDAFAEANNRQKFKYVLHPRATGFTYLVEELRKKNCLDAIYDLTVAYVPSSPEESLPQDEKEFFSGERTPKEVCLHFRRIDVRQMPTTLIGLDRWLQEAWVEKEKMLKSFYERDSNGETKLEEEDMNNPHSKTFNCPLLQGKARNLLPLQYLTMVFWFCLLWWFLSSFLLSWRGLFWTIASTSVALLASSSELGGLHEVEIALERKGLFKGFLAIAMGKAKQD